MSGTKDTGNDTQTYFESLLGTKKVVMQEQTQRVKGQPVHLSDLFPQSQSMWAKGAVVARKTVKNEDDSSGDEVSERMSIVYGEPHQADPDEPTTLIEVLQRAATQAADKGIMYVLPNGEEKFQSYAELLKAAERVAGGLRGLGIPSHQSVIFQFERNENFIIAFWGCVLAGYLPTPMGVAPTYTEMNAAVSKLQNSWTLLEKPIILADVALVEPLRNGIHRLWGTEEPRVVALESLQDSDPALNDYTCTPDDPVLNMLTSGSTGMPKCVQHPHRTIVTRSQVAIKQYGFHQDDVVLNWMPLDHVGGIVMSHIQAVYQTCMQVLPKIESFLADPLNWLYWIEKYRATTTWAANFAYAMVNEEAKRIQQGTWDLSTMRHMINGGEAVVEDTCRRFLELLVPHGLPGNAMYPTFGMAEICSGVFFSNRLVYGNSDSGVLILDKGSLTGTIQQVDRGHPQAAVYVDCGLPLPTVNCRVVDEDNQLLPEGQIGRLQFSGQTVMAGYFNNPEANAESFVGDGWFNSGDLAFMYEDRLTLVGREKDVIVVNGNNYYNYEIETFAQEVDGVEVTFVAACAVEDPDTGTDSLVLFFTPTFDDSESEAGFINCMRVIQSIREELVRKIGISPKYVLPVRRHLFPKTNSGKIQRAELGTWFDQGVFDAWIKRADIHLENENTLPDWTYRTVWVEAPLTEAADRAVAGNLLVFADDQGLAAGLAKGSASDAHVILVKQGARFAKVSAHEYQINPQSAIDYQTLLWDLSMAGMLPDQIVHLWNYKAPSAGVSSLAELRKAQYEGSFSLLFLTQAITKTFEGKRMQLTVGTTDLNVTGEADTRIAYEKSTLIGIVKTIPQEYPHVAAQIVDFSGSDLDAHLQGLLTESTAQTQEMVVAYRAGSRFVQRLENVEMLEERKQEIPFVQGGLYMITGALGGIGSTMAAHLLKEYQAHLILLGRKPLERLDAAAAERLRELELLAGTEGLVRYQAVDLCDLDALQTVVVEAEREVGTTLGGIIHLAGIVQKDALADVTQELLESMFEAKVYGTYVLHQLLEDRPQALFIGSSTVRTIKAGMTLGSYCSANNFVENFTLHQRLASDVRGFCFAWSTWDEVGMSSDESTLMKETLQSMGYHTISPKSGVHYWLAGLMTDQPILFVGLDITKQEFESLAATEQPLETVLRVIFSADEQVSVDKLYHLHMQMSAEDSEPNRKWEFHQLDKLPLLPTGEIDHEQLAILLHERSTASAYVPPRDELEMDLVKLWKKLLKVSEVGIQHNFFALGGHSLKATQFLSAVYERYGIELPLRVLFESPTIASFAEVIRAQMTEQTTVGTRILRREGGDVLPMSFGQKQLWFLYQLEPDNPFYNTTVSMRLQGPLQVELLERALQTIVDRHETLRTRFDVVDDEPCQIIEAEETLLVSYADLSHVPEAELETTVQRLAKEEANKTINLTRDLLIRASLTRFGDEDHLLLLTIHHIVTDGWSIGVFAKELSAIYTNLAQGIEPSLPELPVQYGDFTLWQNEWVTGEAFQKDLVYWKEQFADSVPVLELPTDFPRPPVQTYDGKTLELKLSTKLTESLNRLSRRTGSTLFMTLLTGFSALLHRYTGQEDLVVGSVIAGRNHAELEELIGFFANTLALRIDASAEPSFEQLLERVKTTTLNAYEHQDVPFAMLVEELNIPRDLSRSPLTQVLFVLQNVELVQTKLNEEITVEQKTVDSDTSKFDLSMMVFEQDDELRVTLEYNVDLFLEETMNRLLRHYVQLLEQAVLAPTRTLSQLDLLSAEEKHQLLVEFAPGRPGALQGQTVPELFEEQAAATPNAIAVLFGEQSLTYGELNRRANQLAHYLQAVGVKADQLVGLCMERSLDMIVGLLAILKAGGAYVPLDPTYPEERLAYMLADSQIQVLLTQEHLIGKLPAHQATVVAVDTEWEAIATSSSQNPLSATTTDHLAYVIYTSGSTGLPKGVLVPHRGIVRLVKNTNYVDFTSDQVFLQMSTISFDAATFEIWGSLLNGARLAMMPPHMPTLEEIGQGLRDYGVTTLWLTVGLFNLMVDSHLELLTGVKQLLVGGDALSMPHIRKAFAALEGTHLINGYGPTESTTFTCCHPILEEDLEGTSIPIGRPIAGTQVYVLDAQGGLLPIGVPGELHIGGDGLARGYLNRPDLTEEKFVANPFSTEPNARLYRTGDLVRYLPDGNIQFIGRIDNQVKIRGFRIELGEIEAVLDQHAAVQTAVVLAKEDQAGSQRLVAYVVANCEMEELKRILSSKLPDYMVPSLFVAMESLPVTANGKIDRNSLPEPVWTSIHEYVAPRHPMEEMVAMIWGEILQVERIGVHDDFFDLGGHSLKATQAISRLRNAFGIELSVRTLFEYSTVGELVAHIQTVLQGGTLTEVAPLQRFEREDGTAPLSFAQQRLWFLDRMVPDSSLYNIPFVLQFEGALQVDALQKSLNVIIVRHEALRTTFADVDGRAIQVIAAQLELSVPVIDLQSLSDSVKQEEVARFVKEDMKMAFDLSRGPLLRAKLLQLGAQEFVLILNMHHTISDGWSMGVLMNELTAIYQSHVQGVPHAIPELQIQYADFAIWQREWLQGDVQDEQLSYWKQKLQGVEPVLQLPTDKPRPAVQTHSGALYTLKLPTWLGEKLNALSRQEGVTLFMTLLTAFKTLLFRYTHQEDIVVGSPIAGRKSSEVEELIGFFVNTLVLRTDLSGDPSFKQLLWRVRETALEAYVHQDLPFEKIVDELKVERSLSYSPLFQVLFALQNAPMEIPQIEGMTISSYEVAEHVMAKFDLSLSVSGEAEGGLEAVFEYNTDLFERDTIARMAEQFAVLLTAIVEGPKQKISELALLSDAQREQVLITWNDTTTHYPREKSVQQLYEEQAAATPDAIAFVMGDASLTYRELNLRANQLAHYLRGQGIGRDSLVGLCMERSLEMIVGLLGILKAGGAYVPLDPAYPQERLVYMLEDSQVSMLLTEQRLLAGLPMQQELNMICLDTEWKAIAGESTDNPDNQSTADSLAYIIYTSGSTGQPKGVCIPHRGIVRLVKNTEYADFSQDNVFLQLASVSFDAATFEIWGSLLNGAKLAMMPPHMPTLEEIGQGLRDYGVTTLWLTVGLFNLMVDSHLELLTGVKQLLVGGDALSMPHIRKAFALEGMQLINGYGPTESTTFTCCHLIREEDLNRTSIPIGRPIAGTQVYVLDEQGGPVPIGVSGELHIGGDGLATGYLNRPELTEGKFISNPFSKDPEARLYKTGDLVRYLPDGNIEFIGRIDNQVKIRGFRIELGEIETVLEQHPDVRAAVVLAHADATGSKRLVAYVATDLLTGEIKRFVKGKLPDYMVPSLFVKMESLPLTANGKIDRNSLPEPDLSLLIASSEHVAPRHPMEQIVATIWGQILQVERIGVHDNFFDLGGHSLLATQVITRLRNAFGIELQVRILFEYPTVGELSAHIQSVLQGGALTEAVSLQRYEREDGTAPLSFAQQRMWFLDRMVPDSTIYNIPFVLRFEGALQADALEKSLNVIIERHEALRTTFVEVDGLAIQVIASQLELAVPVIDLQLLSDSMKQEEVVHWIQEDVKMAFDLSRGPLLRAKLLQLGAQEFVLILNMHHIISDGWSMGVLMNELTSIYQAHVQGKPHALPELQIQYADFAVWQRAWLQGDVQDGQLSYWKQKLQGVAPFLQLPTDKSRPAIQAHNGALYTLKLPTGLGEKLTALSRQEGVTLFMTLLTAFKTLLYRYTRQEDIVVGSPIAGRQNSEVEELIGFFVNTLALRTDLSGDPSFKQLLSRVRETALEAYAHQDLPFEKIVDELKMERSLSYSPLFQVLFALQNASMEIQQVEGMTISSYEVAEHVVAKFDLSLSVSGDAENGLVTVFEYDTDLFERETIARMAEQFAVLLTAIAEEPEQTISELALLGDAQREQLLVTWNDTTKDYSREKSVQQLYEEQAAATPDAIAVVMGEASLTYRELNLRANQLAHYLRAQGIGRDSLVGICMDRSPNMIVSQLAVWKAGGAYVPMDPAYPQERLSYMLEDAQVKVFLTQERLLDKLPEHDGTTLLVDAEWAEVAKMHVDNPVRETCLEHLAYVIYTSGSTGLPKGVQITNGNLLNFVNWFQEAYEVTAQDRGTLLVGPAFDPSVMEIWPLLTAGASLFIPDEETRMMPEKLRDWLIDQQITLSILPTPFAESQLVLEWPAEAQLRYMITGGEQLHHRPVATHPFVLVNQYGPAECTIATTAGRVETDVVADILPNIGRPIANAQVYVLDEHQNPVPIGVAGELYIGGAGLAKGYLNRPDLTEEKFISNPFSNDPGERLYKTGDLVRYLPDGNIEFIGRIDNQVKVRGFRIELGEIEAVLDQHPDVRTAAVLAHADATGSKRLVAYVVTDLLTEEIKRFVKGKLPDYMVPSLFMQMESLPLTANGKIDRKHLPEPDWSLLSASSEHVAPRHPMEEMVAAIWGQILQVERIGVHDNFFDLGGHSLLATQAISRLRQAFGMELQVRTLFEYPTVGELSAHIQDGLQGGALTEAVPLQRYEREDGTAPLSFAQQRLWFLDRLVSDGATYNMPFEMQIQGELQVDALEKSLNVIIERHEALRTTFVEMDGRVIQAIASQLELSVSVIDLQSLSDSMKQEEVARQVKEEATTPFDLAQGPLFRAKLLQVGAEEFVLLLNMHHIVSDGWSTGVLMNELTVLYTAHLAGESANLPELPLQYADFTLWQREWLQGDVLQEQLAYWKEQLAGNEVLQLPTDRPKSPATTIYGAVETRALPAEIVEGLKALSQREGTTLFMTLLAAYKTLLYRYSGQADFSVGTPVAGRNRSEIEGLIGFFVNTLVLRNELNGTGSFRELLQDVRETALAAYSHQDLPFEKLVEELQPSRDLSQSPLFQVFFALEKTAELSLNLPGLTVRPMEVGKTTTAFDLSLTILDDEHGLIAVIEYNVELFDESTIHRMVDHFGVLLDSIVTDAEQSLSMLPMLTAAEREQVLVEWNDSVFPVPTDKTVHQLFEEQVARTPDGIALICGAQRLTYREVNERANQFAHYLRRLGVGPESLVGYAVERSLDQIVGMLGVLKAGGAYVPLDLAHPLERIAFMLEDTGLSVLVTQSSLLEKLPAHNAQVVCLDSEWPSIAEESVENPEAGVQPNNLVYVIYTSGSTGRPKGVLIEHKSLINHNIDAIDRFAYQPADRVLAFASISFDNSAEEIYPTLLSGAALVLMTERVPAFGYLQELIETVGVTVVHTPTAYWSEWCHDLKTKHLSVPACVRMMVVGGENMVLEQFKTWQEVAADHIMFINGYGPTEATITSAWYTIVTGAEAHAVFPIGRPGANTQLYILDAGMNPVPIGVPGELYIGGDCLARGYLNRADLTAEKFVQNPFAAEPGARMYATGDVVRYLPDGNVVYVGRKDNQIKIRGYRVELGEIENVLAQHPQVRQAVVTLHESTGGQKQIVAYVLPTEDQKLTAETLRSFVKERLPEYMVPSAVMLMEAFPLTPNNKVDRKALPKPELTDLHRDASYVAPRNQTEEMLAAILTGVLGLDRVGIYDNFFEMGGHSLLATQVISRVRDLFGVELPLRVFFEQATVAEFGQRVEAARLSGGTGVQVPPIERVSRGGDLPLSFAQQRLWFLDRFEPNSAMYNMIDILRLEGALHTAALEQSLNEIVRRHEALRTTFVETNGTPMQRIHPAQPLVLTKIDLQDLPQAEREARGLQLAKEDAMTPFDLTTDLMIRASLLKLDEQAHLLVLTTHHIANDGWSGGVFFAELAALYDAFTQGLPSPLPELPIQYADFAVWQRNWMQGEVLEEQLGYWREHLSGDLPVLQLPTDRPRPAKPSFKGSLHHIELPHQLSQALRRLSQREGVSLYMTLLAAFDTLLYRYTGQEDLLVGTGIANRNRGDIEGLIGFFVNTLALRSDLSGNPTFTQLLARVREVALGAFAHQDLPFEKLVEEVQPERDLSQSPLFRVMFVLQNAPMSELKLNDLSLNMLHVENDTTKFDLFFALEDREDCIAGAIQYDAELFDHATIGRMLEHFESLLQGIAQNPAQTISEIPLLSERERQQVLEEWNNTQTNYPDESTIHELFEGQAAQTPDRVAIEFEGQTLTYSELNRRANQLARYLQLNGVQAGEKVGLCVERSLDLIISTLAIVKAGAAYVPLDPNYPQSRLSFMLEDTGIPVLLTHQHLQEKLPVHNAHVICLDLAATEAAISELETNDLMIRVTADALAYVIYTSGSTGRPKGVLVPHRGVVRLVKETDYVTFSADDVYIQFAPIAFDAATFEIWGSLLHGGRLVIFTPGKPSLEELGRVLLQHRVSTMFVTTAVFNQMVDHHLDSMVHLRQLLVGGEIMSVPHVSKAMRSLTECQISNIYGPTESTTFSTVYKVTVDDALRVSIPIGRPIANTQTYVLDPHMQPVPIGVPGELYIGGDGLADGYLNREDLTEERFVSHPFSTEPGARLYKTGDIVRWLVDGNLEFIGRVDDQVKIRGHRIELGEIEVTLQQHANVRDTLVMAREDQPGDKRLVAYIVPNYEGLDQQIGQPEEEWQDEQVSQWEMVFDNYFYNQEAATDDHTFNIIGWNSHFTGEPIPQAEMRVWLDSTLDRLRALETDRVLEIGCGTGMLMYGVLPQCSSYWGMDISSGVLQALNRQLSQQPEDYAKVKLLHRHADNFEGIAEKSFDLVMINSVIQYFPSIEYLVDVVEKASKALDNQGAIFLGDIRSLPLLEAFHTAVELYQASDAMSTQQLQQQAQSRLFKDNELVIDPAFFYALQQHVPQISRVQVLIKRGRFQNELTQFRYDVVLHIGATEKAQVVSVQQNGSVLDWERDQLDRSAVREFLQDNEPAALTITGVPDARIYHAVKTLELLGAEERPQTVAELRMALQQLPQVAVEPEDVWALEADLPYSVEISRTHSSAEGTFDILFLHRNPALLEQPVWTETPAEKAEPGVIQWSRYASNPMRAKFARNLVPMYRNYLEQKLPDYMMPSAFVILDHFPLTPNGKVDRKALPLPGQARLELDQDYLAPRNEVEEQLAEVWMQVLGVERIGVQENFFEIGGHSLLATQMVSRLRETFEIEVPLHKIFEKPTVAQLAELIEEIIMAEIEALSEEEVAELLGSN